MTTAHNRKPITIQADPLRDSDLLSWLRGVPEGQRQRRLKEIMRRGIDAEQRDRDALGGVEDLRYGVEVLHNDMRGLAAILQQQTPRGASVADIEKAVQRVVGALSLTASGATPNDEPAIEAGDRLAVDEIERRESAIKTKAKWKR